MRFYKSLWKLTKVNEKCVIPWYFLCKITNFHSISFNCNALLAFCDFALWQMKFFCLLLYHFAFRQHWQIFCHSQMKDNLPKIADTYQVCVRLPLKRKRMGQNRTRNAINWTGTVYKIPLVTAHGWHMGTNVTVPNDHEQYLPFMIGHYHSYFMNKIKLFYLIYSVKSH
jgi:hypothetical protein